MINELPTAAELQAQQRWVAKKIIQQRITQDPFSDPDVIWRSLIGKVSNALAGALNIQMQVFQRLATAQSFADVQAAVEPALPLMQRIQGMLERGELMSVQYAQGLSDEDAIVEALESMTKVARIIQAHEPAALAS